MKDKILASIVAACAGDAMGAATEMRTTKQIVDKFGGYVKDFIEPPSDIFAKGRKAGQVTDDFSLAYSLIDSFIKSNGYINDETVKDALLNWADNDEYYDRFAGPTTRKALDSLKEGKFYDSQKETGLVNYNAQATNGSAMKIFPVGLFNPANVEKAIEDAIVVCKPTHFNNLSIAGATAIAASVAIALKDDATLDDVIEAGIYGARVGFEKGTKLGNIAAGPNVEKRIKLAVKIGKETNSFEEAMTQISDLIGCGIHVSEAVPAVYGLLAALNGSTLDCIYAAVNMGNDTDTVATMIGAICGALNGMDSLPKEYLNILNEANNYHLENTSQQIVNIIGK